MEFEWDPQKAVSNIKKHGVRFEEAVQAFYDPNGIDFLYDEHTDYEIRYRLLAVSPTRLLMIGYTIRHGNVFRIITARKATAYETRYYNESKK